MRMRHVGLLLCAAAATAFFTRPVSASIVTFSFQGTLTSVTDPDNLLGGATTYSATYSFDTAAVDTNPGDTHTGNYAAESFIADIGPVTLDPDTHDITVEDNIFGFISYDRYTVAASGTATDGTTVSSMHLLLTDYLTQVFSSDALPTSPPNPADFGYSEFVADFTAPRHNPVSVIGTIDQITPEPSAISLLLIGAAGLLRRRRHAN